MTPDISVVVPTRNRAHLLDRLLTQLRRLDRSASYELVVVNEASTDETSDVLRWHLERAPVVVVENESPLGAAAARNRGIEASHGRYVAWIDDDDLTSTDRLYRQFVALESSPHRWSCAGTVDIDDDLRVVGHRRARPEDAEISALLSFNRLPSAGQGVLVERQLLDEVGLFDNSLERAMDWEICIRLSAMSSCHMLDEPLVGFRVGATSLSSDTAKVEEAISAIYRKHRALYDAHDAHQDWASIDHSLLLGDLTASRTRGVRRAARIFSQERSVKAAALIAVSLVSPRYLVQRSRRVRQQQVPGWWQGRAESWLREVEPGECLGAP